MDHFKAQQLVELRAAGNIFQFQAAYICTCHGAKLLRKMKLLLIQNAYPQIVSLQAFLIALLINAPDT